MEDVPYGRILREGWLLVLVCAVLGAAGAYGVTRLLPETYASTSTLMLQVDSSEASLFERNQFSLARIRSYPELVDSPEVIDGIRSDLNLSVDDYSDRDLRRMVSAENTTDTVLLVVRADAPTASMSADIANSAARHLSELIKSTENTDADKRYDVNLGIVLPAVEPLAPISPQVLAITGLGLILGLALGGIASVYRTLTSRYIRTIADVRRVSGQRVVGRVPRKHRWRSHRSREVDAAAAAFDETIANLDVLTGSALRSAVLLSASPDAVSAAELHGLSAAFIAAGRPATILDTRGQGIAGGGSLADLLATSPGAPVEGFAAGDEEPGEGSTEATDTGAQDKTEVEPDGAAAAVGSSSTVEVAVPAIFSDDRRIPAAQLERQLPPLVRRLGEGGRVIVVVADEAAAPLARELVDASRSGVVIAVRSGSTSASDLVTLVTKLSFSGVHPLGVLLTGAAPGYTGVVTETWRVSDRALAAASDARVRS